MGCGRGAELTTHSACVHYTQMGHGRGAELTTHSADHAPFRIPYPQLH